MVKTLGACDFIHRHHEVHRSKLYVSDKATFTTPLKYVDVMGQTMTSIDGASEHTLNDRVCRRMWTQSCAPNKTVILPIHLVLQTINSELRVRQTVAGLLQNHKS